MRLRRPVGGSRRQRQQPVGPHDPFPLVRRVPERPSERVRRGGRLALAGGRFAQAEQGGADAGGQLVRFGEGERLPEGVRRLGPRPGLQQGLAGVFPAERFLQDEAQRVELIVGPAVAVDALRCVAELQIHAAE
jgi:hypothetical protein